MGTFAEARQKHLQALDDALDRLRELAADPGWANPNYGRFVEAKAKVDECLATIIRLNAAEQEARH